MNIRNCDNKMRLRAEYRTASVAYSKAVSDVSLAIGRTTQIEYERLNLIAELSKTVAAEAGSNLDMHTYQHGC